MNGAGDGPRRSSLEPSRCGTSAVGGRFLFDADGRFVAGWPDAEVPAAIRARVDLLGERSRPGTHEGAAFLPSLPRIRLLIVGAGHVGQAVAALAAQADFDVWVVDDRHQYANAERFPAARRILVGPIEDVLGELPMTPQTYALIVTRGHGHDQEALFHLAPTAAAYVGLIGSRRKIRLIFEALREQGMPDAALARVAAPVGLDIGSQTCPRDRRQHRGRADRPAQPGSAGDRPARLDSSRYGIRGPSPMRVVGLIPAAGQSRRMGRPKLTLGLGRESVIQRVVAALVEGGCDAVLVMAPPVRAPGAVVLANHARVEGAEVVHLDAPTYHMRATIELGLDALVAYGLAPADGVLLTPGDVPGVTSRLVLRVLRHFEGDPTRIIVPSYQGKLGHPLALPWALTEEIASLPAHVGVNALLEARADRIVTVEADEGALSDLDTPDDYRRWRQ